MFKDRIPESQDPLRTANIMAYELGYITHDLLYADLKSTWNDEKGVKIRLANARINLADLITMCRLLAEQMDWSWLSLIKDGEERFSDRMEEIEDQRL